jgi:DNA-binding transcriptional LysR family regulator
VDDGLSDIVAAGFDAGIRPGELVQRDVVAVRVTPDLRCAVVGSPGYIALRSTPWRTA